MRFVDMKCPACGGPLEKKISNNMVICEYCGSRFALEGAEASLFADALDDAVDDSPVSDLPMPEFAAEACADFLEQNDNGSSFDSSRKILKGLEIPAGEEVYLIHDDTMFHSGKNGFAITERGLYCREMGGSSQFTSWEAFGRADFPEADDSYIKVGTKSVAYFTDDSDIFDELVPLYEKLYRQASR